MKILVRKKSLRLGLPWVQRALFAAAILMLGYCGFVLVDTWMFQHRERQSFDRLLQEQRRTKDGPLQAGAAATRASLPLIGPFIGPDGLIGRIEVPRLGVSVAVLEGTGTRTLRRAAGHIAGTALPGQIGNIGIAGHRDTFFRPLRNIRRDDIITMNTLRGQYRYRVVSIKIVGPEDVAVLRSDGNQILTLVTCYPFYFVGSAPKRFIVRAEKIA